MRPHLVVKLKPDWRYDESAQVFRNPERAETRDALGRLPAGSMVVHTVPGLARSKNRKLSSDERNLARFVQILLPDGAHTADLKKQVQRWDFVESVQLPPSVSLP